ncbi:DUF1553 domain-containing protein, partial [uncultured Gimesia sp.]|uniref:DUF1553 domain-containing protein n=1 Tax=uncultured Gimesia sp. TaxID=1678688 RepID=UPI0026266748
AFIKSSHSFLACLLALPLFPNLAFAEVQAKKPITSYSELILSDKPVVYWSFDQNSTAGFPSVGADLKGKQKTTEPLTAQLQGRKVTTSTGPRPSEFPLFKPENQAAEFKAGAGYLRVVDPGEKSVLDFTAGDSITLEAWVNPNSTQTGKYSYIIGKGRTNRKGVAHDNQNYGLRLAGSDISFLFRGQPDKKDAKPDYHRWTSKGAGISAYNWHHIAVTYTFGKKKSLKAYVDGRDISGTWDMGGDTTIAPVVDNDEVWLGSSMGGSANSSFDGRMDEVAIYRTALSAKQVTAHFKYVAPKPRIDWTAVPSDRVQVDVFEGVPNRKSWTFRPPRFSESITQPHFALIQIPFKYSNQGLRIDRSGPFLIRALSHVTIPKGKKRILVRARNASRLYIDEKLVAETGFHKISGSAHGKVFDVDRSLAPNIRPLHRGDQEKVIEFTGDGKPHRVRFEMFVGGFGHRPDLGETAIFIGDPGKDFQLLSSNDEVVWLTDDSWLEFERKFRHAQIAINAQRRQNSTTKEDKYWEWRHQLAKREIHKQPQSKVPTAVSGLRANNAIDHFINQRLAKEKVTQSPLLNDLAFLRRLSLDTTGTVPSPDLIQAYLADNPETRRANAITRLLNDPGWADNWVGYWQDVLAENPNVIKPTLNNSGPFRWWIHESFYDNKPFDRFLTELVMMEGSKYFGGPAGFEMASQNDAPMAAKAHIVGQAFLGLNMKCARCHDAPFHDFKQRDLFSLAAMLKRSPQGVPKTSSVPGFDSKSNSMLIAVTLLPGANVMPKWTFEELIKPGKFPENYLRSSKDTREQLAAIITSPRNERFANVIVNRVWKRYLGQGLVEPVDDWSGQTPSHPELLKYLSQQFVIHGYDFKTLARSIFESDLYQRQATTDVSKIETLVDATYNFASPVLRRMEAEQIVDSMFSICGKPLDAGRMCIDLDGALNYPTALDLGSPRRAWEFTTPSNERDRPSLALPFGQPFITLLKTFGWRDTRQNPMSVREYTSTALQPAILANGVVGKRFTRLSDDSDFTKLSLQDQPVEELIAKTVMKTLTREPTDSEREMFVDLLQPGYADRVNKDAKIVHRKPLPVNLVGWSNHLSSRANEIKVELEHAIQEGDPPTQRLKEDWRNRYEDVLWTLLNS